MSLYEQNIRDFSGLYADRPEVFTQKDLDDLAKLQSTFTSEDDIQKISDSIALWCEARPTIYNALLEIPPEDTQRGPGGRPTRLTTTEAMSLLENIVRTESDNKGDLKSNGSVSENDKDDKPSQSSDQK
ncbi:MAG: hypothetical protein AAFZ17_00565 [Cyanobacteria bacterium J06650_10]